MPTGAPSMVIVSAIPTIINATPNIPAITRPVMLSTRANKFHTATKGHKNHGDVFFVSMITSILYQPEFLCKESVLSSGGSGRLMLLNGRLNVIKRFYWLRIVP